MHFEFAHLLDIEGLLETVNFLVTIVALVFALLVLRRSNYSFQKRSWLLLSISAIFFSAAEVQGLLRNFLALGVPGLYELAELGFALTFAAGLRYLWISDRLEISKLRKSSVTDGLTDLYNHAFFEKYLADRVALTHQPSTRLSVLFIDVDHFKEYNDSFGHDAGNAVLKTVAKLIVQQARDTDLVSRYGGEEFTVVINTSARTAQVVAERIRKAVEQICTPEGNPEIKGAVTVSIGIATLSPDVASAQALIKVADACMYRAKSEGRNKVCLQATPNTTSNPDIAVRGPIAV